MSSYGQVKDSQTGQAEHVDVGGVCAKRVIVSGYDGVNINDVNIDSNGNLSTFAGMSIPEHDYIGLSYTGTDLTGVVYKLGGSGGTTVATLTLAYTANVLQSVSKS